MPEGGRLRVEARRSTRRGEPALEISVSDTGKGIPPEEQAAIFQPFHTTKTEGTGLGLAIVQRIVDDHGGEIDLQSAPGLGSTFALRFPLQPGDGPAPSSSREVDHHS
jgi:signal transduction histidine kinase